MGWAPTEVHEHRDADGNVTGTTVVTREPAWDDEQRDVMLARHHMHRLTCAHGHHAGEGMDPSVVRWVEHGTAKCLDCEAEEKARQAWHKQNQHSDSGPCPCRDEMFWIDRREPISATL